MAMAAGQSPGGSGGDAAIFYVCPDGSDVGAAPAPPSGPPRPGRPRTGWWRPSRRCCSRAGDGAPERLLLLKREGGGRGRPALLRVPRRGGRTAGAASRWCRCMAGLRGCGTRAGARRSPAQSPPCRPRGVSPVRLLLCTLQQYREFPQETSVSKTAPVCTEVHGAQHLLGSETKQRPIPGKKEKKKKFSSSSLPSAATAVVVWRCADAVTEEPGACVGSSRRCGAGCGSQPAADRQAVLRRSGCPRLTRSRWLGWAALVKPHTCTV